MPDLRSSRAVARFEDKGEGGGGSGALRSCCYCLIAPPPAMHTQLYGRKILVRNYGECEVLLYIYDRLAGLAKALPRQTHQPISPSALLEELAKQSGGHI